MRRLLLIAAASLPAPTRVLAQLPLSRADAVERALTRGERAGIAAADSSLALAALAAARAWPNPDLGFSYTKDAPRLHAILGLPLDFLVVRSTRVGAAAAAGGAARLRTAFALAGLRFAAESLYVRALALSGRAQLSRRTALAADSLLRMARARRDAGDASELDVELATINAGQLANTATNDSLAEVGGLLDLQLLLGLNADRVGVQLTDTLGAPAADTAARVGPPLTVAAAESSLRAAEQELRFERRSPLSVVALELGVDWRDPGGQTGLLPVVGLAFRLPLFYRNRGEVAAAAAILERERLSLALARRESQAFIARATRERAVAEGRVTRGRALLASAERVAAMSLSAYAEGAAPLASALEAQRNARELLAQYLDDVAALEIAAAALRLFTATSAP